MKPTIAKYSKRDEDLDLTSERVVENMENNPSFPNPPAALAELKKKQPEFRAARKNAELGDKEMVSIKNELKETVQNLLQEVADFVTVTAKGNRSLILNSGFDVPSENNAGRNQPPSVEKLEVELGQAGEVTTIARNVTNAKAYAHQYTKEQPNAQTEWMGTASSHATHTFEGLSSGQQYWFRVVVVGFKKQRAYSPIVSRFIQ
jgi:hypothetical protein